MGALDGIGGLGAFGNLLGGYGVAFHPSQMAAMQQPMPSNSFFQSQAIDNYLAGIAREQQMPYQITSPRKKVESREITPRERARKQINGAVQAVKDAQLTAKS